MLFIVLLLVLTALGLVVAALVTTSSFWAWLSIVVSGLAGLVLAIDWVRRRRRTPARGSADDLADPDVTADTSDSDVSETAESPGTADATDTGGSAGTADSESEPVGAAEPRATADDAAAEPAGARTVDAVGIEDDDLTASVAATESDSGGTVTVSVPASSSTGGAAVFKDPAEDRGASAREPVAGEGVDALTDTAPRTALLASSGELAGADVDPPEEDTSPDDALLVADLDAEVLVVDEYPRYHLTHCAWLGTRATIPLAAKEARDLGFSPCALCGPDAKLAAAHRRRRSSRRSTA